MLQTYATQKMYGIGYEVEIINFVPKGLTLSSGIKNMRKCDNIIWQLIRKFGACVTLSISNVLMIRFLKKNIHLSDRFMDND